MENRIFFSLVRPRMVIMVDHLSLQERVELSQYIKQLPTFPHFTLVKLLPAFPVRFFQLPQSNTLEARAMQMAAEELSQVEKNLGFPTVHQIISRTSLVAWMDLWNKAEDMLIIGKKARSKPYGFFRKPSNLIDIQAWLTSFQKLEQPHCLNFQPDS
jgi:hypothetical protein